MKQAFISHLLAASVLTDLVDQRIHWGVQPDGVIATPYVTLHHIGGGGEYSLDGVRAWKRARVQIDVWADRELTADAVWTVIEAVLSGFAGVIGDVEFSMIRLEGDQSRTDTTKSGAKLHGHSGDFSYRWKENV